MKQTTSQRPKPGRSSASGAPGAVGGTSRSTAVASEGNRFSKTTTWYSLSGISVGRPGRDGSSGHSSAGGRKVRDCRCEAIATHSPSSAS